MNQAERQRGWRFGDFIHKESPVDSTKMYSGVGWNYPSVTSHWMRGRSTKLIGLKLAYPGVVGLRSALS